MRLQASQGESASPPPQGRFRWRSACLLLLTLPLLHLQASSAQATCGDYLLHVRAGTTAANRTGVTSPEVMRPMTVHRDEPDSGTPCHGPSCRQAPPPTAPSSPVELKLGPRLAAILVDACRWNIAGAAPLCHRSERARAGFREPLLRPPIAC